jgi:hypothetical protein
METRVPTPSDLERLVSSPAASLPPQDDPRFAGIKESRFDRGGLNGAGVVGLKPFFEGRVPDAFKDVYSEDEVAALAALKGSPRDIEERMKVSCLGDCSSAFPFPL